MNNKKNMVLAYSFQVRVMHYTYEKKKLLFEVEWTISASRFLVSSQVVLIFVMDFFRYFFRLLISFDVCNLYQKVFFSRMYLFHNFFYINFLFADGFLFIYLCILLMAFSTEVKFLQQINFVPDVNNVMILITKHDIEIWILFNVHVSVLFCGNMLAVSICVNWKRIF